MGKYMRKAKIQGDVAMVEISHSSSSSSSSSPSPSLSSSSSSPSSSSGVRTRSRTLALQPQYSHSDLSYLQLRSRRLHKQPPPLSPTPKHGLIQHKSTSNGGVTNSLPAGSHPQPCHDDGDEYGNGDCCGENFFGFDSIDRSTRESTPCSLIRGAETIATPGSTTRSTYSGPANRRARNSQRAFLTTPEMEEFFAGVELHQQQQFIDKYNYDIMNDLPLPGRYEWVRVDN